jgi:hypothetical protein
MLVHCDQDCAYQKDGYCTVEPPSAITHYEPNGCIHCVRTIPRAVYEANTTTPAEAPQKPVSHF